MSSATSTVEGISLYLPGLAIHGLPYRDNETGIIYLSLPERIPFMERDDTRMHICKGGETLHQLVNSYYSGILPNPLEYLEDVRQFQDDPILDIFVPLDTGRIVLMPSHSYLLSVARGEPLHQYPVII